MIPAADNIVKLGVEVGKVLNKVLETLPNYQQRQMRQFYEFEDKYNEEILREDSDSDTLLLWKHRRAILLDSVVKEISSSRKK